jgi:dipeptidyl aminopeptidase/acylaminoacyl peptidase
VSAQADSATGKRDLWLVDIGRAVSMRFTFEPSESQMGVWSPDGSRLAFAMRVSGGGNQIYLKNANGSGVPEPLPPQPAASYPSDWSLDGRFLLFARQARGSTQLWVMTDPTDPAKRQRSPTSKRGTTPLTGSSRRRRAGRHAGSPIPPTNPRAARKFTSRASPSAAVSSRSRPAADPTRVSAATARNSSISPRSP